VDTASIDTLFRLAAVLLLVLVNAFFVAAEFSIVTVRRTRVEQLVAEHHPLARSLRRAVSNPAPFIATTQLGVTVAGLALGWIGEPSLAAVLEPALRFLPPNAAHITAESLAVAIAFLAITTVDIVVGELIPKSLALQRPETVGFVIIEPLLIFQAIFRPFVAALTAAGALGVRLVGLAPTSGHGLVYSVDELRLLVTASRQAGVLDEAEEDMIERVFGFAELHAHEVMVPRTEMVGVPVSATVAETLAVAATSHHGRFPVYHETIDDVVGVVYVLDLLRLVGRSDLARAPIRPLVREALVLPETIPVDSLIENMRRQRTHLAILVDEYGGTAGMVTLVDVLERIAGPVPDQFEPPPPRVEVGPDGSFLVDGMARLDEVDEELGLHLESEVYDTLGGYVLGEIGRRPQVGDRIESNRATFQVEAVDGLRIARVRIWPPPKPAEVGTEEEAEEREAGS
jgi:CBS domain containing-hemolysin-like protein